MEFWLKGNRLAWIEVDPWLKSLEGHLTRLFSLFKVIMLSFLDHRVISVFDIILSKKLETGQGYITDKTLRDSLTIRLKRFEKKLLDLQSVKLYQCQQNIHYFNFSKGVRLHIWILHGQCTKKIWYQNGAAKNLSHTAPSPRYYFTG